MRTDFFNSFVNLKKRFAEDWEVLWSIKPDTRVKIIPFVVERLKADTRGQAKGVVERAVAELGEDEPVILKVLDVLQFVAEKWNPVNDKPQALLEDMQKLSLFPAEQQSETEQFMLTFLSALERDSLRRLKEMFANSGAPTYRGSSVVVDFRPVFDRPFGTGLDDKLADYRPQCVGWVSTALVQILYTDIETRSVMFQCSETDMRRIMDTFEAALRDMQAATESFGVERLKD